MKIESKQNTTGFPHVSLVPLHGGLTAWIRGDSRMLAATPEFTMSEGDHGATDGLHLGDAGGEEKKSDGE